MAQRAGRAPEAAAQDLSQVLPQLVDAATVNGKVPDPGELSQMLAQLLGNKPAP